VITITGLGPGDFDRIPAAVRHVLLDPEATVVVRTLEHPAARELAALREIVSCDDLYQAHDSFDAVYAAIVNRVLEAAADGRVVYAVPGSPTVGELAVRRLLDSDTEVEVLPAESFLEAVLAEIGYDPLERGLQILNGHDLPDPLVLDKPTIVAQLDRPEIMADVAARIGRVVPEDTVVTVLVGAGSSDGVKVEATLDQIDSGLAGYLTSMFIDSEP
jgi:tetrapyrrole methylase family protein/MazG family protein